MIRSVLGSRASIGGPLGSGRGGAGNGLLTGLVAYWGLDEASGANNALDKHGGGLTLTQNNSPGADTGIVYATARTFNGSNQYFSRASETALNFSTGDFALALWLYSGANNASKFIINKRLDGSNFYMIQQDGSQYLIFEAYVGNVPIIRINTNSIPTTSAWTFVVVNVARGDTAATRIHINNVDTTTGTPTTEATSIDNSGAFNLGRWGGNGLYWNGRIGPVAMWKNRTLDATARAALWNGGNGLAYSAFTA